MICNIDYEEDFIDDMELHKRQIPVEQIRRFRGYAAKIFTASGIDIRTPSAQDTPRPSHRLHLWRGTSDEAAALRAEFFSAYRLQR